MVRIGEHGLEERCGLTDRLRFGFNSEKLFYNKLPDGSKLDHI
jgi:hypothetical protein